MSDTVDPKDLRFVLGHPQEAARQMTRDTKRIKELEAQLEDPRLKLTREDLVLGMLVTSFAAMIGNASIVPLFSPHASAARRYQAAVDHLPKEDTP